MSENELEVFTKAHETERLNGGTLRSEWIEKGEAMGQLGLIGELKAGWGWGVEEVLNG